MKRGVTLLEVLVTLAIIVAIGVVTVPVMLDRLDERAFEAAVDVASQQLVLARAEAVTTGRPVEVRFEPAAREVVALWSDVGVDEETTSEGRARLVPDAWARRVLPGDARMQRDAPTALLEPDSLEALLGPTVADEFDVTATNDEPFELAVYLPDGSCISAGPVWLIDEAGRVGQLAINGFSGLPLFTRLEDLVPADLEQDEEKEEDQTPEEDEPIEEDAASSEAADEAADEAAPEEAEADAPADETKDDATTDEDEAEDDEEDSP